MITRKACKYLQHLFGSEFETGTILFVYITTIKSILSIFLTRPIKVKNLKCKYESLSKRIIYLPSSLIKHIICRLC